MQYRSFVYSLLQRNICILQHAGRITYRVDRPMIIFCVLCIRLCCRIKIMHTCARTGKLSVLNKNFKDNFRRFCEEFLSSLKNYYTDK